MAAIDELARSIFQPLNFRKREIRLVRLAPSRVYDSPLVRRFSIVTLGSRPSFEALYWCWGDLNDTEEINLEDRAWCTNERLVEALKHLRFPESERTVWVDALSINQGSYHEEAKQERLNRTDLVDEIHLQHSSHYRHMDESTPRGSEQLHLHEPCGWPKPRDCNSE